MLAESMQIKEFILVAYTMLNFAGNIPYAWMTLSVGLQVISSKGLESMTSRGPFQPIWFCDFVILPSPKGIEGGNQKSIKRKGRTIQPCQRWSALCCHSSSLAFKVLKAEFPQSAAWLTDSKLSFQLNGWSELELVDSHCKFALNSKKRAACQKKRSGQESDQY